MTTLVSVGVAASAAVYYLYRSWWAAESQPVKEATRKRANLKQDHFRYGENLYVNEGDGVYHEFTCLAELEKYYQALLHKHVGGTREVKCRYGFVDVLTEDAIYEVKCWSCYKNVIGQLVGYESCFKGRKKVAVLFGKPFRDRTKKRHVVELLKSHHIEVWMYDSNDILFEL